MKIPVASKKRKIVLLVATALCLLMTLAMFLLHLNSIRGSNHSNTDNRFLIYLILMLVADGIIIVSDCITLVSYVVIDETGIMLKRGALLFNHLTWNEIERVESFVAFNRKWWFYKDNYIRVSCYADESLAFKYRYMPFNIDKSCISFAYDSKAYELIKQYYKGDIHGEQY